MSEFHSLANLIKRLEVATTRLEDLAQSASSASAVAASSSSAPPAPSAQAAAGEKSIPASVQKHDEAIGPLLNKFLEASKALGDPVAAQAALVAEAIEAEKTIIHIASLAKKPDMSSSVFMKLIEPIQKALSGVVEIKEKNRGAALFNHLSVVAEGVPALGWFTCEPTPVPFIRDMKDAAQFYANRVVKEWKDKDKSHLDWSRSFIEMMDALSVYVKENFPTGLTWNAQGESAEAFIGKAPGSSAPASSGSAAPAPAAAAPPPPPPAGGAPPPPPPPPPPMTFDNEPADDAKTGAAAVFAEINKGESVTAGLRKVDKSQMTHKNPALRAGNTVTSPKKQAPPTPSKPNKYVLKKPAKTTLEANKWVIEYHENNNEIVIEETAINQAVYIFGCKNSTIRIKGKVNAITMDSCVKCGIALDSTVSTVDLVNCRSFGLQIFHVTPTIAVDKCDSGSIYLSKECLNVEILSAKSTSVNVLVPEEVEGDETDFKEVPIPEQLKTTIGPDGKLVTVCVEHAG
ncbi:adenylate cyclase associated N terminal-domain-containing protein [Zychaea mexicana]|uniref:adenylate cyclase associated N terminal-domain-containing protein n=1 Tax=Zychaea mexicana TaxID=64656 RepID=UPI0022FE581F|nr:adenylate cyclase associated N terminal-domain-containing protein [Zychaea mexicana]KAI9492205.1 adenylate cyclase associated N terminal-domain-containing protein [Zychaea mexicana]